MSGKTNSSPETEENTLTFNLTSSTSNRITTTSTPVATTQIAGVSVQTHIGNVPSVLGVLGNSYSLDFDDRLTPRFYFVKTLDEFTLLTSGKLRMWKKMTHPNHIYYVAASKFFEDIDELMDNSKNVRNIRDVNVIETIETKEWLGSTTLVTSVKSVLYKLIPRAVSK